MVPIPIVCGFSFAGALTKWFNTPKINIPVIYLQLLIATTIVRMTLFQSLYQGQGICTASSRTAVNSLFYQSILFSENIDATVMENRNTVQFWHCLKHSRNQWTPWEMRSQRRVVKFDRHYFGKKLIWICSIFMLENDEDFCHSARILTSNIKRFNKNLHDG